MLGNIRCLQSRGVITGKIIFCQSAVVLTRPATVEELSMSHIPCTPHTCFLAHSDSTSRMSLSKDGGIRTDSSVTGPRRTRSMPVWPESLHQQSYGTYGLRQTGRRVVRVLCTNHD